MKQDNDNTLTEELMCSARSAGICAEGIARISHMDEKWKDIKGFEGVYAISDMGRVYSYRSRSAYNSTGQYYWVLPWSVQVCWRIYMEIR